MSRAFWENRVFWGFGVLAVSAVCLFSACGGSGKKSRQAILQAHFAKFKSGDSLLLVYASGDTLRRPGFQRGMAGDTVVLDSNGTFTFSKQITEPLYVKILYSKGDNVVQVGPGLFLDVDSTILEIDSVLEKRSSIVVKRGGGAAEQDFLAYLQHTTPLALKSDSLRAIGVKLFLEATRSKGKVSKALQAKIDNVRSQFLDLYFEGQSLDSEFIVKHPKSNVSAWLLGDFSKSSEYSPLGKQGVLEHTEKLLAALDKSLKQTVYLRDIDKILDKLRGFSKGALAPDFRQANPEGELISLASFRGKILVLDFWASWCGPCRKANPHMVKLYHKFKDKGVDFLGVSLDEDKEEWVKAIKADKLTWTHVSDLRGFANQAAILFDVHAIPATYLIDREGRFIGNYNVDDLEAAIEDALK